MNKHILQFGLFLTLLTSVLGLSAHAQSFIISSATDLPNRAYLDGHHLVHDLSHEQRAMHAVRTVVIKDLLSIRLSLKQTLGRYLKEVDYKAPAAVKDFYVRKDGINGQTIMEIRDLIQSLDAPKGNTLEGAEREIFERLSVASWALARIDSELFYLSHQIWNHPLFEQQVQEMTQFEMLNQYGPHVSPQSLTNFRKTQKERWAKEYGIDKRLGELLGMRIALLEQFPFLSLEVKVQKGKSVVEVPFYQCIYGLFQKIYGFPETDLIQEKAPITFNSQDARGWKDERGVFKFAPETFENALEDSLATQLNSGIFPFDQMWARRDISEKFSSELVRLTKIRLQNNTKILNDLLSFKKWPSGIKSVTGGRYTLLVLANSARYWQMTREHYHYMDHLIHWQSAQQKINSLYKSYGNAKAATVLTLKVGAGALMGASLAVSFGTSTPFVLGGTAGILMSASTALFSGGYLIEYYDSKMVKDFTMKTFYGAQGVTNLNEKSDSVVLNDQAFRNLAIQMILMGVPARAIIGLGKISKLGMSTQIGTRAYAVSKSGVDKLIKLSKVGILKDLVSRTFGNIARTAQMRSKAFIDKMSASPDVNNQFAKAVEKARPGLLSSLRAHDNPIIREKLSAIYMKYAAMGKKLANPEVQKNLVREISVEVGMSVFLEYSLRGEAFWKEMPFVITNTVSSIGIIGAIVLKGSPGSVRVNMWSPRERLEKYNTSRWKVYKETGLHLSKTTFWTVLVSAGGVELYDYMKGPAAGENPEEHAMRAFTSGVASALLVGLSSGLRAQAVMGWFQPRFKRHMHNSFGRLKGDQLSREGMWWLSSLNNGFGLGLSILTLKALGIQEHELLMDPIALDVINQTENELENSYVYQNDVQWGYAFGF